MASVVNWALNLSVEQCLWGILICVQFIGWLTVPSFMRKLVAGIVNTIVIVLSWVVQFLSYCIIGFVKLLEN